MPGATRHSQQRHGVARRRRGFALVITLALMVLLTLLVTGLLSLSAISLRSTTSAQAISVAQSNARLGLMLALGELQSALGPDKRVSASAAAVLASAKQPHLTGAWESSRWDQTKPAATFYAEKRQQFRRWLVSTATPDDAKNFQLPAENPLDSAVELVGTVNGQNVFNSVRAGKIPVMKSAQPGALAWAVFDESCKASIDLGDPAKKPTAGEEVASRGVPNRFRADTLDFTKLASLKTPLKLVTLETAVIPAGQANAADIRKRFHDFTTGSLGLLADTANGGLKTDLTSLFEAASFPSAAFPATTLYSTTAAAAPCWSYLYDHYRKYKTVTSASLGTPTYAPPATELAVSPTGKDPSPKTERLLPVIAKMQLVFSLVSHNSQGPRADFLNNSGDPKGNGYYAVPHLVYEPVITLFNPYDVALDLKKIRIRIWDPPVGFRFAKIFNHDGVDHWFRDDMKDGSDDKSFHGLARFQWSHEQDLTARRSFTLCLTDGTSSAAGTALRLQPGEVKVFSSRVQSNWSWEIESSGGAFFDWNKDGDFGNRDNRTSNPMGVEAVPGWDTRAGLQTDSLSYGFGIRPNELMYDFEKGGGLYASWDGYVSIKTSDGKTIDGTTSDEVKVELKALRSTAADPAVPDFQVDVCAGNTADASLDLLRRYRFNFANPTAEISANPASPVISRKYRVWDLLQAWADINKGGKRCLAMLEMTARTTRDPLDDSKAWLYNNPVVEGGDQATSVVGAANQSYDLRLIELTGWTTFPIIELDGTPGAGYGRGYFGASRSSSEGVTNVPMCRVPVAPAASLGDLIPTNLVAGSPLPRVVHPFGNSRAHPLLPPDQVSHSLGTTTALDHSYLLNDALWDRYYFSSVAAYSGGVLTTNRSRRDVLEGVLDGSKPALNARLRPAPNSGDATLLADKLDGLSDPDRATQLAAHLAVGGPFNLNSTSTDAWRAVLAALRDREVSAWKNRVTPNPDATPFVRMGLPLACPKDTSNDVNVLGQIRWAGYRSLSDTQIEGLAAAIVTEIQRRGIEDQAPPLTLAEFINRRPGAVGGLHSLAGILQTAIDNSGLNSANHLWDSKNIKVADIPAARKLGTLTPEAMNGFTGEGAPSSFTQGDLLGALAAVATVRGDTFKIRSYGEATTSTGKVQARAWCEAVVQRVPDFVDPADAPATAQASLTSQANISFGRGFHIVSFRWLSPQEIR